MLYVKSSRMQYQAQLDKEKEQKDKEHVKQQKDILQEGIDDLQKKKEYLVKTTAMLDDEFVNLVERAEKEQNVMLVTKATAMKRKKEENKSEIEKLEATLNILAKK